MEVKIAVVGSSHLITDEIRIIVEKLLDDTIEINTYLTSEVTQDNLADLYLCGPTQYETLLCYIPTEKLIQVELTPASTFFLSISRIPEGNDVYIFNNRAPYTRLLAQYCQKLGLDKVNYKPIAFDEMPQNTVLDRLKMAKYIIGVDRFLDENVLLSSPYKDVLAEDIKIISGKRTISLHSAFMILHAISVVAINQLEQKLATPQTTEQKRAALNSINKAIDMLQKATIKSVVSQADAVIHKNSSHETQDIENTEFENDLDEALQDRLSVFRMLNSKFENLLY